MVNKTNSDIFVAGLGAISAIGNDVAECLYALENRQAGIAGITYLETVHRQQLPVAEVKLSNEELALRAGVSPKISRTALLSLLAARAALDHAGINNEGIGDPGTDATPSWRTAFVSANTVTPMST